MNCEKCGKKAVIVLQHGSLCKHHFIDHFESKVFKTINRFQLIGRNEKICVAASGGKDSLTVLYLTKKYLQENNIPLQNLFALVVDEGIQNYREHTIVDLERFCKDHAIILQKVKTEDEFGATLDKAYPLINKDEHKKPCNVCGVWRRYLLNKYARKYGAETLVTGHNLDDEAQAIMMNIFKANTKIAARLGPKSGIQEHDLFVQRVKPLYLCSDKEVRLYTLLKGFTIQFAECPYSSAGYRHQIQEMLNDFEEKYTGTKQGIVNSFLALLPALKETAPKAVETIKQCSLCQEPAEHDVCNACSMKEILKNAL
ncbi:MAG: TIGR00269 family protein [Nanoarchaeota archaeon]|nr:TIGR00269 family protein [Nanoarchaeota archaeon]